jgi:hypothetical protein
MHMTSRRALTHSPYGGMANGEHTCLSVRHNSKPRAAKQRQHFLPLCQAAASASMHDKLRAAHAPKLRWQDHIVLRVLVSRRSGTAGCSEAQPARSPATASAGAGPGLRAKAAPGVPGRGRGWRGAQACPASGRAQARPLAAVLSAHHVLSGKRTHQGQGQVARLPACTLSWRGCAWSSMGVL